MTAEFPFPGIRSCSDLQVIRKLNHDHREYGLKADKALAQKIVQEVQVEESRSSGTKLVLGL